MFVHEPVTPDAEMAGPLGVETACPLRAVSHCALPSPVAEQLIGPMPKGPNPDWREAMAAVSWLEELVF